MKKNSNGKGYKEERNPLTNKAMRHQASQKSTMQTKSQIQKLSNTLDLSGLSGEDKIDILTFFLKDIEINKSMRRRGLGTLTMFNVIKSLKDIDNIELASDDSNSDSFYNAIGMVSHKEKGITIFNGDKKWMNGFVKNYRW